MFRWIGDILVISTLLLLLGGEDIVLPETRIPAVDPQIVQAILVGLGVGYCNRLENLLGKLSDRLVFKRKFGKWG